MDPTTVMYVSQAIHGIAYGMVLFLVASGLTMIFGMMDILNLAHAAFFMLSAYFCYQFLTLTGSFWAALLLAPLATAFFGIILERFFLRKIHAYGLMSQLVLTVGVTLVILAGVKIFWGTESLPVKVPPVLSGLITAGGLDYPIYRVFVIVLSLAVLAIMALLLFKTRLGKIVRAAVSDSDMVNALGINVPLVSTTVFGVGIWLAGVAGVAIAPILTVFPGLEAQMGMDAFVVVITGGFGSLSGAFLVSIIFGLLSSFGVQFVSTLAPVLMFAFMAIVLAIKPTGLFGERE
jgi:branched-chain amino acid transport system permease protein